jgi:hypothetical protein
VFFCQNRELSHHYTEMLKAARYRKIPGIFAISGGLFQQKITYATVPFDMVV